MFFCLVEVVVYTHCSVSLHGNRTYLEVVSYDQNKNVMCHSKSVKSFILQQIITESFYCASCYLVSMRGDEEIKDIGKK